VLQGRRGKACQIAGHFTHDVLLRRFRQMTAYFGEEAWCGDEYETPAIVVAGSDRDALGELPRKLFDGVLFVTATRLQTRSSRACACTPATCAHDDAAGSIGTEIAIVSRRERVFERLERARRCARLA
jgi:hypothetical protein